MYLISSYFILAIFWLLDQVLGFSTKDGSFDFTEYLFLFRSLHKIYIIK